MCRPYSKALSSLRRRDKHLSKPGGEGRGCVQNAIELAHALRIAAPKVAILSAVETVTSKIPSTIDAAALCKMAERGQITGAVLDGPLAFDNAISHEAAVIKHIVSPVAGDADILLVPGPGGRQHAGQGIKFPGRRRCGGHRARRARPDYSYQPRRQCPHPAGELRGRCALCPCPPGGGGRKFGTCWRGS